MQVPYNKRRPAMGPSAKDRYIALLLHKIATMEKKNDKENI